MLIIVLFGFLLFLSCFGNFSSFCIVFSNYFVFAHRNGSKNDCLLTCLSAFSTSLFNFNQRSIFFEKFSGGIFDPFFGFFTAGFTAHPFLSKLDFQQLYFNSWFSY